MKNNKKQTQQCQVTHKLSYQVNFRRFALGFADPLRYTQLNPTRKHQEENIDKTTSKITKSKRTRTTNLNLKSNIKDSIINRTVNT